MKEWGGGICAIFISRYLGASSGVRPSGQSIMWDGAEFFRRADLPGIVVPCEHQQPGMA